MTTDPIGDFINQLKNAQMVHKSSVSLPYSMLKHAVADKLVAAGWIKSAAKKGKKAKKMLEVELSYDQNGAPRISHVERVSKPGRRLYGGAGELKSVQHGKGALIVSTPKGILTDDEARKEKVGGEMLFKIW